MEHTLQKKKNTNEALLGVQVKKKTKKIGQTRVLTSARKREEESGEVHQGVFSLLLL